MHFTPFKFEIDFNLVSQLSKLTIYAIEYHNNVNAGLLFCHISAFNPFKTASLEKKMKIIFKNIKVIKQNKGLFFFVVDLPQKSIIAATLQHLLGLFS